MRNGYYVRPRRSELAGGTEWRGRAFCYAGETVERAACSVKEWEGGGSQNRRVVLRPRRANRLLNIYLAPGRSSQLAVHGGSRTKVRPSTGRTSRTCVNIVETPSSICDSVRLTPQSYNIGAMTRSNRMSWPTLLAACVCVASAQRAGGGVYRDVPIVNVRDQGIVSGVEVILNKIGHRAWQYLGIPFAKPPVGDLRFAAPDVDPPPAWTGIRNGSVHMPGCIQDLSARQNPVYKLFASITVSPINQYKMSEDCLYLNVYRPEGEY